MSANGVKNAPLLEMRDIQKSFPGVQALSGVSLTVKSGTCHALMGENGAGKSTLMKCLFGIYAPNGGEIYLSGERVRFESPRQALDRGVAMVHQELSQALSRSVTDNVWLGRYKTRLGVFAAEREMREKTADVLRNLDISIDPRRIMSTLSVADRQMVEIAKAVSFGAKIIVLDEPTSSLSSSEVERLFAMIRTLKKRGCGIIYISHKMEEILQICDEITVMRDGKNVATAPASAWTMEEIIRHMVGRELTNRFPQKSAKPTEVILEVEKIASRYQKVKDVSFTLQRGEILGFAGLAGAGRSELFENLFGLSARESGQILLKGREIINRTPREAKKNGFAFLTEERRANGIFGILNVTENTTISSLKSFLWGKIFIKNRERVKKTDEMIDRLSIKTASRDTKLQTLSGGNQQKVIFARWLLTDPEILLLDEPTRGIDVGAKYEVYELIESLAARGKSVLVSSSELPELLGICHRIAVMSGGALTGILDASTATQEQIIALAAKNV